MATPDDHYTIVRTSIGPVDVRNGPVALVIPGPIRIPLHTITSRQGELPHDKLILLCSTNSNCSLATRATATLLKLASMRDA